VTEVAPVGPFWEAEPEHQDYLERYPRATPAISSGRTGSFRIVRKSPQPNNGRGERSRIPEPLVRSSLRLGYARQIPRPRFLLFDLHAARDLNTLRLR